MKKICRKCNNICGNNDYEPAIFGKWCLSVQHQSQNINFAGKTVVEVVMYAISLVYIHMYDKKR